MSDNQISTGERAREFWEAGLRIFPLNDFTIENGVAQCGCGWSECIAAGKHPVASNWQHTPHWGDEQIETMIEYGQLASGYGVLCNGLLVIDVDARNGGIDSYKKLLDRVPDAASAGMIVNTGSGGGSRHLYFKSPEGVSLVTHLSDYPGLDFKSSGYVVGPASRHSSGGRYTLAYGGPDDIDDAPDALISLLRRPERHRAEIDGRSVDVSHKDIAEMLAPINPDCDYDTWIRIGMAVHHSTGGSGEALWDEWSSHGSKYNPEKISGHWHSFGRSSNPVTLGTLTHHAQEAGWIMPVTFEPDIAFDVPDIQRTRGKSDLPFDTAHIDLTSPPGFVGEVADWIEAQSRRPRKRLAVAGALTAVGNIAGLKYTDDRDGVTANLFTFCIAGSRTGKESVQQSISAIHRAAGCAAATHGSIKSEQEIVRNLVRHQAAFYVVDEIGIFLQKIKNAQKKGGAAYLDGVIGMLMSVQGKANGFMLLTGDMRDSVRVELTKELSAINRKIDEGDASAGTKRRYELIEGSLNSLDNGLERPLLSLIGFTTPVTFDDLVDFDSATNGFIGRSLLFHETDTAPRTKPGFKKTPMPPRMSATCEQISTAGEDDSTDYSGRVQYYGNRTKIPTTPEASEMLDNVVEWFDDAGIAEKSRTGLEALYIGAYELVSKVSLILAVPEGLRTAHHVAWAFELVRQDVLSKAKRVVANDREKDAPMEALIARVSGLIEGEGMTIGVIYNRACRKYKKEDVDKALAFLVEKGKAEKTDIEASFRRKATVHFRGLV